jgi:hypothetical protein
MARAAIGDSEQKGKDLANLSSYELRGAGYFSPSRQAKAATAAMTKVTMVMVAVERSGKSQVTRSPNRVGDTF